MLLYGISFNPQNGLCGVRVIIVPLQRRTLGLRGVSKITWGQIKVFVRKLYGENESGAAWTQDQSPQSQKRLENGRGCSWDTVSTHGRPQKVQSNYDFGQATTPATNTMEKYHEG